MAVKAKSGSAGTRILLTAGKPKRVRQGQGQHSKPNHGRKPYRGQGK